MVVKKVYKQYLRNGLKHKVETFNKIIDCSDKLGMKGGSMTMFFLMTVCLYSSGVRSIRFN